MFTYLMNFYSSKSTRVAPKLKELTLYTLADYRSFLFHSYNSKIMSINNPIMREMLKAQMATEISYEKEDT